MDEYFDEGFTEEDLLQAYYNGELDPELTDELLQYYDQEPFEQERLPFWDLLNKCAVPTLSQSINSVLPLIIMCSLYKVLCLTLTVSDDEPKETEEKPLMKSVLHITCCILGISALHVFFGTSLLYLIVYDTLAFALLCLVYWKLNGFCGITISALTVLYILLCELVLSDPIEWHKIRGSQMVLSMKVISLAFDLDHSSVARVPNIWAFIGYSFHIGSVIFGPWISFEDYQRGMNSKSFSLSWVLQIIYSTLMSLVCVIMSTCLIPWLMYYGTSDWIGAYRDAQSFRFSHYFVSFISEVTVILSGIGRISSNEKESWDYTVTRPLHIEFPRSLVDVVTNWNLPMHTWLRYYVFKTVKPAGNFMAILFTYAASSLLHGLNFQLAAVLLSLGFYTYVEFVFRNKLSRIFNACVQAKKCKPNCGHENTALNACVVLTNLVFAGLAVFHLAYLGLMFDSSDQEDTGYTMGHTLSKWSNLDYASHWLALATFIFHILI